MSSLGEGAGGFRGWGSRVSGEECRIDEITTNE